jgi:imidazolonepropionase-like amidohydrolase
MRPATLIALATLAAAYGLSPIAVRPAAAASVLIRNATVHTMSARGVLTGTDVLITDGRIAALGDDIAAPEGAEVIDAAGRPVTPGFFGGVGHLGVEEIGLEPSEGDYALALGEMRPEFDVTLAFNPDSTAIAVNRIGGVTFAVLAPSAEAGSKDRPGGTIIAGQGAVVTLDGSAVPGTNALFVDLGGEANGLSGGSRAAQFMLLTQAFTEARSPDRVLMHDERLLTPLGRQALLELATRPAPFVFDVDRAADIRQTVAFARREKLRAVIAGGAEAWRVAGELAAAGIAVILDPLDNLPSSFDKVGATLENAARLHEAGVTIAFSFRDAQAHNVRKLRQAAGNAVAHGLPQDAALAALTRNPAAIFGVADRAGMLEAGRPADLVLWSGDPLEVTTLAERVFVGGRAAPMRSRQTELRDRYLERLRRGAAR